MIDPLFFYAAGEHLPFIGLTWKELWDVTDGEGYQFWSGFGSDIGQITLVTMLLTGITVFWHKHNCHVHRCLRLSWHQDDDGHPVCKVHHKDHPSEGWFKSDKTHPRHSRNR